MDRVTRLAQKVYTKDWALSVLVGCCFILITLGLGYYSNLVIPGNPVSSARYLSEPATHLDFMSEWDGPHYLEIAQHGYVNNSLTAFFPLYPLLIRGMMFIIPPPIISALIVSWLCLVGALYFYIKIIKEFVSKDKYVDLLGLMIFLFFPTAVFLVATYTEGLFALLSLSAIYAAIKHRYVIAGILAGLSTLTHPNGVFIVILIALLLWEARLKIWQILVSLVLGGMGILSYIIYLWRTKNKPLDFVHAQKGNNWLSGHYISTIINSLTAIDLLMYSLIILSVVYWWSRRKSLAIYSMLFVLLPLIGGNFAGYSRYSLMAFPLQLMLLDKFRSSRVLYPLVLVLSAILWSYFVIHYAAGYTGGS